MKKVVIRSVINKHAGSGHAGATSTHTSTRLLLFFKAFFCVFCVFAGIHRETPPPPPADGCRWAGSGLVVHHQCGNNVATTAVLVQHWFGVCVPPGAATFILGAEPRAATPSTLAPPRLPQVLHFKLLRKKTLKSVCCENGGERPLTRTPRLPFSHHTQAGLATARQSYGHSQGL